MKKISIPILIILISIVTGCNNENQFEKVEKLEFDSTSVELSQVYHDSINNFTIRYPKDWTLMNDYQNSTLMGAGPILTDKKTKMTRDGGFGLSISSYNKDYTTVQFYKSNISSIRQSFSDFKIIEEKTIDLNGIKAIYVSHESSSDETPITSIQVYFFIDQKGYILNGTAFSDEFTKYRDLYISIAMTFKLDRK